MVHLCRKFLQQKLAEEGFQTDVFIFPAGEKSKTRQTKAMLEDAMLEKGYRRDCCILAVGGGVVTDLAGFVAFLSSENTAIRTFSTDSQMYFLL